MINELLAYAARTGLKTEPGFSAKKVKFAIHIDNKSEIKDITYIGDDKQGKSFNVCPELSQGQMIAKGGVRSQFLIESIAIAALFYKPDIKEKDRVRLLTKHQYFIDQLEQASNDIPSLAFAAKALSSEDEINKLHGLINNCKPKPKGTDNVTLYIDSSFPLDDHLCHIWWRKKFLSEHAKTVSEKVIETTGSAMTAEPELNHHAMCCLFTGLAVAPVNTHPKIKGLSNVGGITSGDTLISFNKDSYQSYGLPDSKNAATSEITAKIYAETLNKLINSQSVYLGNSLAVYWYGHALKNKNDDMFALLAPPTGILAGEESRPQQLLEGLRAGKLTDELNNYYYVATLSGQSGRVMVRSWQQGTMSQLHENTLAWFDDLQIVTRYGRKLSKPPKFISVLRSLVMKKLDELPESMTNELWQTAINKKMHISSVALNKAVMETRKAIYIDKNDPDIKMKIISNQVRMGLIKAYHIRNKGDKFMKKILNTEHPSPAYHCGCLFAELASIQDAAIKNVGSGVVERYYAATSQAPALRLGQLMSNAKNHLSKVGGGLAFEFENRLCEIYGRIPVVPKILNMEEQSLFALGYYHHMADSRARMADNIEKKRALVLAEKQALESAKQESLKSNEETKK